MRIWLRVYPHYWDKIKHNFIMASVSSARRNPFTGFLCCESFPNVDFARQKKAMDEMRAAGYNVMPGLILNIGSDISSPYYKHTAWTDDLAWQKRLQKAIVMTASGLQDPGFPGVYIDLELYDSADQEHAHWADFMKVYHACSSAEALKDRHLILTQYYEGFCQNMALARHLNNVTWVHESYWDLPRQGPADVARNIAEMVSIKTMLAKIGQKYMPQTMQDIGRDYAAPVRKALADAGITDVFSWASSRLSDDDVNILGSEAWFSRPLEPSAPVDFSKIGLMAFDLDVSNEPIGPTEYVLPTAGTIAPAFHSPMPIPCVEKIGRKVLAFDNVPNQGLRANLGRQISERYTIAFVGTPPSWKLSNDGTGWQLGKYRVRATQSPAGLDWGGAQAMLVDGERHVIICEQTVTGLRMMVDGVTTGWATGMNNLPDGTMTIGNNDGMTSRPVKMDLERMILFEGVDNTMTRQLAKQLCSDYGIKYRGVE